MLSTSTNAYTLVTLYFMTAAMGCAVMAGLTPGYGSSRKTAIVLNLLGVPLVAIAMILISVNWDMSVTWLARVAFTFCLVAAAIIAVNFLGLYQANRAERSAKSTLDKLRVNKTRP